MSAKVLFVDDEEEIRALMTLNFQSMGLVVDTASSGSEALSVLKNHTYDLIVSDVKMANGSGIDLLKELNVRGSKTPFVFLTAYLDLDGKKLLEMGALKVFYKPTKFSEIENFIKQTLDIK